jgi:hypothetical protein
MHFKKKYKKYFEENEETKKKQKNPTISEQYQIPIKV